MNSFVRLIFTAIGLCVIASLTVVLFANARSTRQQALRVAEESQRFADMIHRLDGHFRRADLVVDWQKVDSDGHVVESALLVRQYRLDEAGPEALPVQRVIIPGDEVSVDGLQLDFNSSLPGDFAAARGAHFSLLAHVFGQGQPRADQFTLLPADEIPPAARVHADYVTHHEQSFWYYVWYAMTTAESRGPSAPAATNPAPGVDFAWTSPATRKVRRGLVYAAFIGSDGVSIQETDDRRLLSNMLTAARQEAAADSTNASR